jgi:hypothetical protein
LKFSREIRILRSCRISGAKKRAKSHSQSKRSLDRDSTQELKKKKSMGIK